MHMAYAFCDELWSAQQFKFRLSFLGICYMHVFFKISMLRIGLKLKMFSTIVVVRVEEAGVWGIQKG